MMVKVRFYSEINQNLFKDLVFNLPSSVNEIYQVDIYQNIFYIVYSEYFTDTSRLLT